MPIRRTLETKNSLCSDKGCQEEVETGNRVYELGFTKSARRREDAGRSEHCLNVGEMFSGRGGLCMALPGWAQQREY